MVRFLLRGLVAALGFWVASHLVPGVHVGGWKTLIIAGLLLGVANALVRPILTFLTFPLTILTLGLFLLVVNGLMILLVQWVLHRFHNSSFEIHGLVPAIFTTIVIFFVSLAANMFIGGDERQRR
ncbi:MAG TPA: phage holin family protein [Caulobacteraceae bacterium]|jgi:putative membrane protein|nr:phage holin family protein [Caulobacteraceae bacterium]